MKKGAFIALVSLLALTMVVVGGFSVEQASAEGTLTLKVGHVLAPTHPYQLGLEKFAQLVSQKTGGKVVVQVFHSSQLGNEREMIEGVQLGTLDMTLVSTAPLAGFSNKFLVFDLPFIFQSRSQAYKVLDGPIGTKIMESLDKNGIKGLAYWENGFRHLTNSKRPVNKPGDVKGLKIRTMENKIHMASFRALGADPTPMAFGELFTALQQRVVDGQENPLPIIWTSNFFEVQKNLALTGHFYAAAPLLINKAIFEKMPKDVQQAIQEAAYEARDYERGLIKEMDDDLVAKLKAKGMKITTPDKAAFLKAMQPVYTQFEKEIGKDLIDQVRSVK
ncbi:MAG: TRAP transporter substrate-binding protein [Syntrophothermus sp.]